MVKGFEIIFFFFFPLNLALFFRFPQIFSQNFCLFISSYKSKPWEAQSRVSQVCRTQSGPDPGHKLSSQRFGVSYCSTRRQNVTGSFQVHKTERMALLFPQNKRAWKRQVPEWPTSPREDQAIQWDHFAAIGAGSPCAPAQVSWWDS